jgi:hypothetical protein
MKQRSRMSRRLIIFGVSLIVLVPIYSMPDISASGLAGMRTGNFDDPINAASEAINKANAGLKAAEELRRAMQAAGREISRPASFEDATPSALSDLGKLTKSVSEIHEREFAIAVTGSKKELIAAKKGLSDAQTSLQQAAEQTPEIKAASARIAREIEDFDETTPNLDGAKGELDKSLVMTYAGVKGLVDKANKRLTPLERNAPNAGAPSLLSALPSNLPLLSEMMRFNLELQEGWTALAAALKLVVSDHDSKAQPVNQAAARLTETVNTVATSLEPWMKTLAAHANNESGKCNDLAVHFKQEPQIYENQALNQIKDATQVVLGLDRISQSWKATDPQLAEARIPEYDTQKTKQAQEEMNNAARRLSVAISNLRDSLAGDFPNFVTERIRLYYFTDIPRLVKTLNDTAFLKGGDEAAHERAEAQLQRLQEAEAEYREADAEVANYKRRVIAIERQLKDAKSKLDSADGLLLATTRKLEDLRSRPAGEVSSDRLRSAERAQADRQRERDAAKERHDQLSDEESGLPAKQREAQARLEEAQKVFEQVSTKTLQVAQVESAAFARARDNAPYWYAPPLASSPDPVKRVEISSSTSGDNTIFLRGREEDIRKVKQVVAKMDEPAPQARMTLWKIELSSDASRNGTKKFNEALQIVERELAQTRAQTAAALSLLLDCINEEVNRLVRETVCAPDPDEEHCLANARYGIYAPQVLSGLGLGRSPASFVGRYNPRAAGLKDPASATTLNEALIVLLLSKCSSRKNILANFERLLPDRLQGVNETKSEKATELKWFARFEHVMASDLNNSLKNECSDVREFTRQQGELIYALRSRVLRRFLAPAREIQTTLEKYRQLQVNRDRTNQEQVNLDNLEDNLLPLLKLLYEEFGVVPNDILTGKVELVELDENSFGIRRRDSQIVVRYSLTSSTARAAAADGMLDAIIKAFEDDIDREFVRPMLKRLGNTLRDTTGIGVGVIQRTSVLATNRLVARVDPRASAELALGEEQNLLQALQQISQLTLAAQTGGALGVLGAFQSQVGDEREPEIYGISTGNTFQVTPIFDPTGQALRFRFDFVGATRIREPNDSTNPRLARIERHTVNTEVQIGNLEIREVSRFEANARLGLPTRYWGGLPIVKDIPGIRPVPFIGWFIRRGGKAAVMQQSLIFAQTTMSPTIGDILELLNNSFSQQ